MIECYCPKYKSELYYYYCGKTKSNVIQQAVEGGLIYDKIVRIGIVERRAQNTKERRKTVRAKIPAQQPQPKIPGRCIECPVTEGCRSEMHSASCKRRVARYFGRVR